MKLTERHVLYTEPTPSSGEYTLPYTWLDGAESDQRAQYMTYLETNLKDLLAEHTLSLLDATEGEKTLSISDPRLPFDITGGTTDAILVDNGSIQYFDPLAGVRMVIRLKKKVHEHHKPQAFVELVSASLKSEVECTPIGLLTYLTEDWRFNEKKVLTQNHISHPKNAFDFITAAVAEPGGSKRLSVSFIDEELTKLRIDDFLPKPPSFASEMMERYELMADVLEPEFLKERRVEYAQHLVKLMFT
ncbi:hypothetical protein P3T76_008828 [Phytophthora citrophthora]|uniref:Crinkler (CRN) family protein n=1 Tax=Phytophthora citrophthora TaxID=4793 RepID=A0AAD9LJA3_9STRA|nr:hypothetical protein P3T76_008828 [Phytophthora citrophthora]